MSDTPEPIEPNSIRAELESDGQLVLHCGAAAFARLRDLLAAEACDTNELPADPDLIESVLVTLDEPKPEIEPTPGPTPIGVTWEGAAAMFSCLVGAVALLAVFCIGVVTVARWCFG